MPDILQELTRLRLDDAARDAAALPLAALEHRIASLPPPPAFRDAFARPGIIAELKRASPSEGPIRPSLEAAPMARDLAGAGAAALSVLCEPHRFRGSRDDLSAARAAVSIPLLCKDFVASRYPIAAARAAGASAVLLIVAALDDPTLRELLAYARDCGLAPLVETHDADEIARALDAGADVVGVNCRDLRDFSTDPARVEKLLSLIPSSCLRIAESGIHAPADIARLLSAGAHAFLVGTALMRAPSPPDALRTLLSALP